MSGGHFSWELAKLTIGVALMLGATMYAAAHLIEWLSQRVELWRWKHIEDIDRPGDVYLSRLMLVRSPWFGLYLHIIRRPDWSKCQHDHPRSFTTLIVRGGYEEICGDKTFIRKPGYIGYRPRAFEHAITRLLSGPAVTIVLRGPNHEQWGFRTAQGRKIAWQRYVKSSTALRVFWCEDKGFGR